MAIDFQCPHCRKKFSLNDRYAGTKARCSCGNAVTIPATAPPDSELKLRGALRGNIAGAFAAPPAPHPPQTSNPLAPADATSLSTQPRIEFGRLNKGVCMGGFLGGLLSAWTIYFFVMPRLVSGGNIESGLYLLLHALAWTSLTSAVIFWILILHRMWAAIQTLGAGATAGEAVAFLFVPFYNIYWLFQAYWGWTQDYNKAIVQNGIRASRIPESLPLAAAITGLLSFVPYIGSWAFLGHIFLMGIFFSKGCDAVNAIVDAAGPLPTESYGIPDPDARKSGLAIASLVLALCGIFTAGMMGILGIVGTVLGICGSRAVRKSAGRIRGSGLAAAATVACAFTMVWGLCVVGPAFLHPGTAAPEYCAMKMRRIANAMRIYADRHDGKLPLPALWCDELHELGCLDKSDFCCSYSSYKKSDFAMNKNLEKAGKFIPRDVVVLFESKPGWNRAGGPEMINTENHHGLGCNIVFGDGSIAFVLTEQFPELRWKVRPDGIITEVASAEMYIRNATACLDAGRFRPAVEQCNKAIDIDPENPEAHYLRGLARFNADLPFEAIQDYTAAILMKNDYVEAYGGRAMAYYRIEQYDKAWSDVQAVQRLGAEVSPDFLKDLYKASQRKKAR